MSKNCQSRKKFKWLTKKSESYYTHRHRHTNIYMAVNKIYTIHFDYNANGTESLGLVKKIMLFHLIILMLIVKHRCFSCSRNEKQPCWSKSILLGIRRNLSTLEVFQHESGGCEFEGLQWDPGTNFFVLL